MKNLIQKAVLLIWIGAATLGITKHWYTNPDSFPSFIKSIGNKIIDFSGTQGADQVANLELLFVVLSALLVAVASTWILLPIIKRATNRMKSRQSV